MHLTPKEIVKELDKHIIGQHEAKKAVAIALRSSAMRKRIPEPLKSEIVPKNILMIGPTGVGKTEIARRLAKLNNAPFVKVEATKYTEVGYVGKDVESIIRDLVEIAVKSFKDLHKRKVEKEAEEDAKDRIIRELIGDGDAGAEPEQAETDADEDDEAYAKFEEMFDKGELDETEIEIEVQGSEQNPFNAIDVTAPGGGGSIGIGMVSVSDLFGKMMGGNKKRKRMKVAEAFSILKDEALNELVDSEHVIKEAIKAVEEEGIVFIDEIDKIAFSSNAKGGEVSREGVQRDLLPLIEGTTVQTKYGMIKTDHIFFIGSGAFYSSKPSDLSPELQGRFPIRVELKALSIEDMVRILKEPDASLTKQYTALLKAQEVELEFAEDGIAEIAETAAKLNTEVENIGARRLYTIVEKVLHDVNFEASEMAGQKVVIDRAYVQAKLKDLVKKVNLAKFIL